MKRLLTLIFTLWTAALATQAQETENYGAVWTEVSATKVLPYDFSIDAGVGFRSFDWFDNANRFDANIGLGYKLGKYFKFGLCYTFIARHYLSSTEYKYTDDNDFATYQGTTITDDNGDRQLYKGYNVDAAYWTPRHRLSFDISADKRFWKTLRVSLRERYQYTYQGARAIDRTKYRVDSYDSDYNITDWEDPEVTTKDKSARNRHLLRSRLKFAIDKKGWKWEPFVSAELHNNIKDSWHIDKIRCVAGAEYALSKQHKLSAAYVFTHENDDDGDENIHAISLAYHFKF